MTITPEEYVRPLDQRWIAHQMAFTRALGHRHLEAFGIIPNPAVKVFDIRDDDVAIVLTTDGVTDALTDNNIINIIKTYGCSDANMNLLHCWAVGLIGSFL